MNSKTKMKIAVIGAAHGVGLSASRAMECSYRAREIVDSNTQAQGLDEILSRKNKQNQIKQRMKRQ